VAFINPPVLKLDFTGAANIADFSAIDGAVRNTILSIINSMFTLPNRYLVKLDASTDYFKTFHYPLGIIRITVEKAWGFAEEAKGATKKLFNKITRAHPDCFTKVDVGAEESWQTKTINNSVHPKWNETKDFVVSDLDQCIKIDVEDHDVNSNDEVGIAVTTVREMMAGGSKELTLIKEGQESDGRVQISAQFFRFTSNGNSFSASDHKGDGKMCGFATILIAGAYGIEGNRKELR
jgi:Ca2+-dependent lipid-binding protein